jgi:uncharacterized hydrophobic protein (TIGR00271 family)
MNVHLIDRAVPVQQRRTLDELTDDLVLSSGDAESKTSAFWVMLSLSAVIATAGVLGDSTATVIGAMIIAPLATPIMGIALGIARRSTPTVRSSAWFVLLGGALVVAVGVVFAQLLPSSYDLLGNSQISSRTSPGLLDMVAAVATGFAGAVALARRDVAAVLPGVAIAISLVPPLAVVGVCLGSTAFALALGALLLFLSNLVALVLAGSLVFVAVCAVEGETHEGRGLSRRARLSLILVTVLVAIPLLANTAGTYLVTIWTSDVHNAADAWISDVPGATVTGVEFSSPDFQVEVQTPDGTLPPIEDLMKSLSEEIPAGFSVVITTSVGQEIEAGTVGH